MQCDTTQPGIRSYWPSCQTRSHRSYKSRTAASDIDKLLVIFLFARSALELLVPPFLERDVVLVHVVVVEIDEFLDLVGGEADALVEIGRDHGVGDGRIVAHVDGKCFLRALFQHGVQIIVAPVLVVRVLGNDEARDVGERAFRRRNGGYSDTPALPFPSPRPPPPPPPAPLPL